MTPKKRKRLRYVVAAVLVGLVAGIAILFATGPVHIPLLSSLLAYQGTRGQVELSIGSASVDFTAPDGINILISDAGAHSASKQPAGLSRHPRAG